MKKLVLVIICILTLSSGPAYAERSTFMLRAQKVAIMVGSQKDVLTRIMLQNVVPQ